MHSLDLSCATGHSCQVVSGTETDQNSRQAVVIIFKRSLEVESSSSTHASGYYSSGGSHIVSRSGRRGALEITVEVAVESAVNREPDDPNVYELTLKRPLATYSSGEKLDLTGGMETPRLTELHRGVAR